MFLKGQFAKIGRVALSGRRLVAPPTLFLADYDNIGLIGPFFAEPAQFCLPAAKMHGEGAQHQNP